MIILVATWLAVLLVALINFIVMVNRIVNRKNHEINDRDW